jgi:hypothetical protein
MIVLHFRLPLFKTSKIATLRHIRKDMMEFSYSNQGKHLPKVLA